MIATIPHIKGKDLSPDLLHQFNIRPEQIITITIKTEAEETLSVNPKKEKVNGVKLLIGYVENPS